MVALSISSIIEGRSVRRTATTASAAATTEAKDATSVARWQRQRHQPQDRARDDAERALRLPRTA